MSGIEHVSKRLVEQRLRNRAIEALDTLSQGDDGVREVGAVEYVEQFFDVIHDDSPWNWRQWSCFTPREVSALAEVERTLRASCTATPVNQSDDHFISSGWPSRIQPHAKRALDVLGKRGRFSEDVEEEHPSLPA